MIFVAGTTPSIALSQVAISGLRRFHQASNDAPPFSLVFDSITRRLRPKTSREKARWWREGRRRGSKKLPPNVAPPKTTAPSGKGLRDEAKTKAKKVVRYKRVKPSEQLNWCHLSL